MRHFSPASIPTIEASSPLIQPAASQVEKNWSALFEGIPDFHAELLATATEGDTLWAEWHWTGTRVDEAPLDMRGVTLFEIKNGRIVSGRLYMEEVEEAGADIGETVRRLAQGDR